MTGLTNAQQLPNFVPLSLFDYAKELIGQLTASPITAPGALLFAAALIALALLGLRYEEDTIRRRVLVILWLLGPAVLGFIFQRFVPFFFARFVLYAAPALYLLAGVGVALLLRRAAPAGIAALVLLGAFHIVSLTHIYTRPDDPAEDYRPLIAQMQPLARPGDAVIHSYVWQAGYLDSYLPNNRLDYQYTNYAAEAIERDLSRLARDHTRFWLLDYAGPNWRPGDSARLDQPDHPLANWLTAHALRAGFWQFGKTEMGFYVRPDAILPPLPAPSPLETAQFGAAMALDYTPLTATVSPGDVLAVPLNWRAAAAPRVRYTVFVHVRAPDGRPIFQSDADPAGGARPTDSWQPGDRVDDVHLLLIDATAPPGQYPVYIGLYLPETGARLTVQDATGQPLGDSLMIGMVEVTAP
jgi:hypothetical protein